MTKDKEYDTKTKVQQEDSDDLGWGLGTLFIGITITALFLSSYLVIMQTRYQLIEILLFLGVIIGIILIITGGFLSYKSFKNLKDDTDDN